MWPIVGECAQRFEPNEIKSQQKSITQIDNYLFLKGRWKRTSAKSFFGKPPIVNTVFITCNRQTMSCKETIAELVTKQDVKEFEEPWLLIDETTYKIIDWDYQTVRAVHQAQVADIELKVSVRDGVAERRWSETRARGSETFDPKNSESWVLE
jgi:hypothetical protein